jgi:hypothetical protein
LLFLWESLCGFLFWFNWYKFQEIENYHPMDLLMFGFGGTMFIMMAIWPFLPKFGNEPYYL